MPTSRKRLGLGLSTSRSRLGPKTWRSRSRLGLSKVWEGLGLGLISDWKSNVSVSSRSRAPRSRLHPCLHVVRVNSKYSYFKSVLSGILPGSILGPLLFVIYNSDLPSTVLHLVNCCLFADDAKFCKYLQKKSDKEELRRHFAYYPHRLNDVCWSLI